MVAQKCQIHITAEGKIAKWLTLDWAFFYLAEIGEEHQDHDGGTQTVTAGHDEIQSESSDEDKTLHDVKTSLLSNGFNQNDRETRL